MRLFLITFIQAGLILITLAMCFIGGFIAGEMGVRLMSKWRKNEKE